MDLNIIQFACSPLGLAFQEDFGPFYLSPAQIVVLKLCYGLELDDEALHTFRTHPDGTVSHLTEVGFVDMMPIYGKAGAVTSVVLGRRSGKSLLGQIITLYEVYSRLSKQGAYGKHGILCLSSRAASSLEEAGSMSSLTRRISFLSDSLKRETRQRLEFQRGPARLDVTSLPFESGQLRGLPVNFAIVQEAALFGATMPTVTGPKPLLISFTSSSSKAYKAFHKQADLQIQIPSWALGDWISSDTWGRYQHKMSDAQFQSEFGAVL